jgi:hypothetical protein
MSIIYVELDLGSSGFQQVAIEDDEKGVCVRYQAGRQMPLPLECR